MVAVAGLACLAPMILLTIVSLASASATPEPGELSNRELGPYDLRIQADSPEEAATLLALAKSKGASDPLQVVVTPGVLTTDRSAASAMLEISQAGELFLQSRFRVVDGHLSADPDGIALTRDLATALGVGVGDLIEHKGRHATVTAVVLNRSNHAARTALVPSSGPRNSAFLGDPARTQYSLYLHVSRDNPDQTKAVADTFQRRGYGVLTRWSGAESLVATDGEFVQLLRQLSFASLALSLLIVVVAIGVVSRMIEGDLHTLFLLGLDKRTRSLLAALLGSTTALVTAAIGIAIGLTGGVALRSLLEGLNSSDWYATRVASGSLALAVTTVVAIAGATAFIWNRSSSSVERETTSAGTQHAHRWRQYVTLVAAFGLLAGLVAVAAGRWTLLLLLAVFVAPGLAIGIWLRASSYLGKPGRNPATASGVLLTSYVRDCVDIPAAGSAVTAGLLAFPLAGGLMITGLTVNGGDSDRPLVPRPMMAVYNGPVTMSPADIDAIGHEAGAEHNYHWTLALLPGATSGELADAWIPALPVKAGKACPTAGNATSGDAQSLCNEALRGIGLGDDDVIGAVLGRPLTEPENNILAAGGALSLNPALANAGRIRLVPMSGLSPGIHAPQVDLPVTVASTAPDTKISSTVPTVWLSSQYYSKGQAAQKFRPGQLQAAFVFAGPVTPEKEQVLRRAIVRRVEVGSSDEFLVTHLNASQVNLVQQLLKSTFWVALILSAGAAAYTAIALRQSQRCAEGVLHDLGGTQGTIARWRAGLVGASTLIGTVAAVLVAALSGTLVVFGEVGQAIPAEGWLRLLPLVTIPVVAAAIAAAFSYRRRSWNTFAWGLGPSRE